MAKGIHAGISGTARKIVGMLAGVGNFARKVIKVYAGDANNIARLVWEEAAEIPDGPVNITWTTRAAPLTAQGYVYAGCWDNNMFVVLHGGVANCLSSPNGLTWTHHTGTGGLNPTGTCMAYGNGVFIAGSGLGFIGNTSLSRSTNGAAWTSITASGQINGVAYGNGIYVAVLQIGANRVYMSSNGTSFTAYPAISRSWYAVCYGNGLFVAVSISANVMTSTDGINWTERNSGLPVSAMLYGVCYGDGLYVAVGADGTIVTSPDGINWTPRTGPANNDWRSVCWGNGLFVAVANSGTGKRSMVSRNGLEWYSVNTPADSSWLSVFFGNGLFVATAQTGDTTGTVPRIITSPGMEG